MAETESEERVSFRQIERSDQAFARETFAERDLDSVFPEFMDGKPITWGGVFAVASPGPPTATTFRGVGWQLHVQLEPYDFERRGDAGQAVKQVVPPPVAVLSVLTGETTLNAARDIGRPLLRSLIGFISIRTKLLTGATLEWEGASLAAADGKIKTFTAAIRAHLYITDARVAEIQHELESFDPLALKGSHRLALEWVAEAWSTSSPALQLANLWFAVVVVVDQPYSRSQRGSTTQMDRVKGHLLLFPISQSRRDDLYARLDWAYELRNKVVHEGERAVSIRQVEELFDATREFLLADITRA